MDCVIYKGELNPDIYLYVSDAEALADVPQQVLQRMGELIEVMELELTPGRKLARANCDNVIEAIRQQGFYLQIPPPKEPSLAELLNPRED